MQLARAPGLLLIGLLAASSAAWGAALRDVAELPDADALADAAARHPEVLRTHELELLALYRQGDDEGILRHLRGLDGQQPSMAATLRETMAGLYLRERRLYRAGQHLATIPATRRTPQVSFFEANIAARQRKLHAALAGLNDLARQLPHDPFVARDQAQIASLVGDHPTVVAACERLLKVRPADEFARFHLARARMFQGRLDDARAEFEALLARDPRHGMAALNLGLLQLVQGDLRAAREYFVRARAIEARDPMPYVAEAAVALLQGRRAEARTAVAGAVKQNQSDPLVGLVDVLTRGVAPTPLVATTSLQVAASLYPDLERAALPKPVLDEISPAPVAGRIAAASVLLQSWSPRAAVDWLSRQSKPEAAGPLAEMTAIRALIASGDLREAQRRVVLLESGPKGRGLAGRAVLAAEVAARLDDRAAALREMERAVTEAPDLPRLHMLTGDLDNALGRPVAAIAEYRKALQGLPGDARIMNQLAATIALAGPPTQYEEALQLAELGLRRQPHYLLRAWLLDTRADLLHRLGRTTEAYAAYRELSTTVGGMTKPETWHRLGEMALSAGDIAQARMAFEEALDYGRDYPQRSRAVEHVGRLPATGRRK